LLQGFYRRFGLNDRQIDLIAEATPKSDYYMVNPRGNRQFSLTLGPIAKAFCGSSRPEDQTLIETTGRTAFAERWLELKGLKEAADQLRQRSPIKPKLKEAS